MFSWQLSFHSQERNTSNLLAFEYLVVDCRELQHRDANNQKEGIIVKQKSANIANTCSFFCSIFARYICVSKKLAGILKN
jgi:hypothetical protein